MRRASCLFLAFWAAGLFWSAPALALELDFRQYARQFELQSHSLIHKSLAYSCLGLQMPLPDSLPCSPSFLTKRHRPHFYFGGFFSNGFTFLEKAQEILDGKVEQSTVETFFERDQILESEGSLEANVRFHKFGIQYSPLNVRFLSSLKNQVPPLLRLSAVIERGLKAQFGTPLGNNFHFGVQTRLIERQYVIKSFPLTVLGTEEGFPLLTRDFQSALYIEPALSLYFEDAPFSPALTGMLANFRVLGEYAPQVDEPMEMQFGISLGVLKDVRLMADFKSLSYVEEAEQKFHFGVLWKLEPTHLTLGWDAYGMSFGVFTHFHHIMVGSMVSTTWVPGSTDETTRETWHLQMGWRI